jgi:hypothetical protein
LPVYLYWAFSGVVARDGTVCAITYTGETVGDQWPASHAVAVEKAFTSNGVSLPNFAISTANLFASSGPGGSLYGVVISNPPNPKLLYEGNASTYGTDDPMKAKVAGGVVVFGGGLPLYDGSGIIGALGVSGDTSCADHNIAWRVRQKLGLDKVPAGVTDQNNDAIIDDIGDDGKSASGFGHPEMRRPGTRGRGENRVERQGPFAVQERYGGCKMKIDSMHRQRRTRQSPNRASSSSNDYGYDASNSAQAEALTPARRRASNTGSV